MSSLGLEVVDDYAALLYWSKAVRLLRSREYYEMDYREWFTRCASYCTFSTFNVLRLCGITIPLVPPMESFSPGLINFITCWLMQLTMFLGWKMKTGLKKPTVQKLTINNRALLRITGILC